MGRSFRGIRCHTGGIISLAEFANEHYKALECDLMRCGYELKDVGRSLSWGAFFYVQPWSGVVRRERG